MKKPNYPTLVAFQPNGTIAYELSGTETPDRVFPALFRKTSHFAMMSLTPGPMNADTGQEKLEQLRPILEALRRFGATLAGVYGACEFPGTVCWDTRTIVACTVTSGIVEAYADLESIWDTPFDGWEDWMIFNGNRLRGYVCSHEEFGALYGDRRFFDELELGPLRDCAIGDLRLQIRGVPATPLNEGLVASGAPPPFERIGCVRAEQ